jgi:hypothetical protein
MWMTELKVQEVTLPATRIYIGVSQNGWVSPTRILAGSEHLGCASMDAWGNLGGMEKGNWGLSGSVHIM